METAFAVLRWLKPGGVAISGLFLGATAIRFMPDNWATSLGLQTFRQENLTLVGLAFVLFGCLTLAAAVPYLSGPISRYSETRREGKSIKKIRDKFRRLSPPEKAVLVYVVNRHDYRFIAAKYSQPVQELIDKGFVRAQQASWTGEYIYHIDHNHWTAMAEFREEARSALTDEEFQLPDVKRTLEMMQNSNSGSNNRL